MLPALVESFRKLSPMSMLKNPVMFVTEVGAANHDCRAFFQIRR